MNYKPLLTRINGRWYEIDASATDLPKLTREQFSVLIKTVNAAHPRKG